MMRSIGAPIQLVLQSSKHELNSAHKRSPAIIVKLVDGGRTDAHRPQPRPRTPETPQAWFLGCLLLWVVFVPLYLTATGRNPFTPPARR
jgi:hypothetical protein